tara:strand:- start:881 stop:1306 length:426 start_codon:yes stop_codon:yes gene_type:complete
MEKYKFLEHTADVMFEAYGRTVNEVFRNAAEATFVIQANLNKVVGLMRRKVRLENKELDKLLFDYLEELIYLKDAKYMIFKKFKVDIEEKDGVFKLNSIIEGDKIRPEVHELKIDVKAPTLHLFSLKKRGNYWKATIILDI